MQLIFNFRKTSTFIHKGSGRDTKINEDSERTSGNYFKIENTHI